MTNYAAAWKQGSITVADLDAIRGSAGAHIQCPSNLFGDPDSDFVQFQIPKFQRGLVWSSTKRGKFAESLKAGRPIGSFVFARAGENRDEDGTVTKKWEVIDGQQRITALALITADFWKEGHYSNSSVNSLFEKLRDQLNDPDITSRDLSNAFSEAGSDDARSFRRMELDDDHRLLNALFKRLDGRGPPDDTIRKKIADTLQEIRQECAAQFDQLRDLPISVITVSPPRSTEPREFVATVFRNLNDNQPLSPNELLAATWDQYKVYWPPTTDIVEETWATKLFEIMGNRISSTYEGLEDYEFSPEIAEFDESEVSFYDFCYSLSHVVSHKRDWAKRAVFLKGTNNSTEDTEVAFDVLSLFLTGVYGGDLTKEPYNFATTPDLAFKFDHVTQWPQVDLCLAAIDDAAKHIQKGLGDVSSFNSETFNPSTIGKTAAVVYLSSHLALRFDRTFTRKTGPTDVDGDRISAAQVLKSWNKNLKAWWLHDILTGVFIGSDARTEAQRRVWDSKTAGADGVANTDMLAPPPLNPMLDEFCELFVREAGTNGEDSPAQRKKSLQATALMHLLFPDGHGEDKVELDHIVPWTKVDGKITRFPGIPLNHSANYMPLSKPTNAKRQNVAWASYINLIDDAVEKQQIRHRLFLSVDLFINELRDDRKSFLEIMMRRWCLMVDQALIQTNLETWTTLDKGERRKLLNNLVLTPAWTKLGYSQDQADALCNDCKDDALGDLGPQNSR